MTLYRHGFGLIDEICGNFNACNCCFFVNNDTILLGGPGNSDCLQPTIFALTPSTHWWALGQESIRMQILPKKTNLKYELPAQKSWLSTWINQRKQPVEIKMLKTRLHVVHQKNQYLHSEVANSTLALPSSGSYSCCHVIRNRSICTWLLDYWMCNWFICSNLLFHLYGLLWKVFLLFLFLISK